MKRWGKRLLIALLALHPTYLLMVNGALNFRPLREWLNGKQDIVTMNYASAWSWYPFVVEVDDYELWVREGPVEVYVSATHVDAGFVLSSLRDRIVELDHVRGEGFDFRLRTRWEEGHVPAEAPAGLAAIPGWAALPKGRIVTPSDGWRNNWNVRMSDVDAGFAQVWIDRMRLRGPFRVEGGFTVLTERSVVVPHAHIDFVGARFDLAGEHLTPNLSGRVRLTMDRFGLSPVRVREVLKGVTATADLTAPIASLAGPSALLPGTTEFDGKGDFDLDAVVTAGTIQAGSRLDLELERASVRRDGWGAAVDFLDLHATSDGHRLNVELGLEGQAHTPDGELTMYLTKGDVDGSVEAASLLEPPAKPEIDAQLHAAAPALQFDDGTTAAGGQAGAALDLEITREGAWMANLGAEIDELAVGRGESQLRGQIKARLLGRGTVSPPSLSNAEGRFEIGADSFGEVGEEAPPWFARVKIPKAEGTPNEGHAKVEVYLDELAPLLDVKGLDAKSPDFVEGLIDLERFAGFFDLRWRGRRFALQLDHVETDGLTAGGVVRFGGDEPAYGAMAVDIAEILWGVRFFDGNLDITPFASDDWQRRHLGGIRVD